MSKFTQDQMVKIVPGSVWVARHLQAHRHSLARPLSGSCVERLLPVGCGPQGDQKSQACRHGWGEGPREHVPVQPAPGRGEEGGGEPAGQVQSVCRHGGRPLRTCAQEVQKQGFRGIDI